MQKFPFLWHLRFLSILSGSTKDEESGCIRAGFLIGSCLHFDMSAENIEAEYPTHPVKNVDVGRPAKYFCGFLLQCTGR
ncbi:hypothetical protein CLOSTMETH_01206 [[Clostridium] methylpentosum DSM 5476]|uniref:Uncharacterized protein n=1 Tax=[Clostridium] methylpentosum DSM 5476 TaxID=537013 RepID=C0EBI8_9FIRM|nr:hypothetical protein CLOSTMETH_01206 [[Clostridium] methylpentosum DSM 5476]